MSDGVVMYCAIEEETNCPAFAKGTRRLKHSYARRKVGQSWCKPKRKLRPQSLDLGDSISDEGR